MECVYLGEPVGRKKKDQSIHNCQILEKCVLSRGDTSIPSCDRCNYRLSLEDPKFLEKWVDPLEVVDRCKQKTDALRGMLGGQSVFLACGGPSANLLPLEELNRRGIWTLCINNMAGHAKFRPQAFLCSDPPSKFSHSIWFDPGIMKFIPTPKMSGSRSKIKVKEGPEKFRIAKTRANECPNVWGFRRNSWLTPDNDFFLSNGACWGNHNSGVERTGQPKTVCTMLLGIRLLRYLGAGKVFLIGVDFRMAADYSYAFEQSIEHKRDKQGVLHVDNNQYEIVNDWLCKMQEDGIFERFGLSLFNCFATSSLRAFPHVPFEAAVVDCKGVVEDTPSLANWYEKL